MILAWQLARAVVWLKRLARAQESLLAIERERWEREQHPRPVPRPLPASIEVADIDDWNKQYAEDHPVYE